MTEAICPLTKSPCRHCSNENQTTVQRVGVIKTHLIERRVRAVPMGAFCNNDGRHYVRDMKECPVPQALKVPLVKYELSELDWARRIGV